MAAHSNLWPMLPAAAQFIYRHCCIVSKCASSKQPHATDKISATMLQSLNLKHRRIDTLNCCSNKDVYCNVTMLPKKFSERQQLSAKAKKKYKISNKKNTSVWALTCGPFAAGATATLTHKSMPQFTLTMCGVHRSLLHLLALTESEVLLMDLQ